MIFDSYVNNEHLFDSLEELKKRSLVDKIGFSLYYPHQLEYLLKNEVPLDMVQVPYNILDQRFAPYFGAMKDKGIEIHVRSVFLQGLFFMDNEKIFKLFGREVREINQVQALALEQNLNMNELLLSFGLSNSFIDKVVIGVLSKENMIENSRVTKPLDSVLMEKAFKLSCNDESIILPFNWKK